MPRRFLRVRMGVYAIEPGCLSASAAIDKANFARKQVHSNTRVSAVQFDKKLEVKQTLTGELLSGLPQALENGEFKLYLQPKFSPKDLSVIGAEALTRWIKPDGTVVYPDQFIPILESTGHIVELDLYIFEQVAQFLQRNAQAGHRLLPIAVNASVMLAREDAPTQEYNEILEKHNISARMLEIELTETAVVSEYDRVKRLLSSFQSDGMQTSLDDFGAGGSLLNNMVDIPVNTIKLDKLFLTRCSSNARGTDFLREIVHLVKRLGYNVICEGIETEEQVQLLRSLDCDGAQGFWFSKAIPAEEFERRYLCRLRQKTLPFGRSRAAHGPARRGVLLFRKNYTVVSTRGAPPAISSAVRGAACAGAFRRSLATASISLMRFSWLTRVALGS